MNELAALGIILLFALLAGHLVKVARIPEVTGYIFAGVIVGPAVLGWVDHDSLGRLHILSEVALGLILFSIGSIFEINRFGRIGRRVLTITAIESVLAGAFVAAGMFVAGQPWTVSLLLGAIAVETAAASTLMVMRECNTSGPLTEVLTGIIAVNNILCLLAFSLCAAAIDLSRGQAGLYNTIYPLVWQIAGAGALGYLVGLLLAAWASRVAEHGEVLILLVGSILLCVGMAGWLQVSPLVATLAVGATMVNLSGRTQELFEVLGRTDPPLYAIFFVVAGADLNLALLPSVGLLGMIYIGGRLAGKLGGAALGARLTDARLAVRRYLGPAMLSQAGLAIGLLIAVAERFPDLAPTVSTVVLAGVAVFEIVGPIGARLGLGRAGEVRPTEPPVLQGEAHV